MFFRSDVWSYLCLGWVCLYLSLGTVHVAGELSYSCYPNDTIVIDNPGGYVWYRADNNETACNVTLSASDQFIVTGCEKNLPIILILSNRTDTATEIIYVRQDEDPLDLMSFELTCDEISMSGVNRTVPVGLTPSIPASLQQTVSPSFTLTSFIYTNSSKETRATVARSGDELYWNIVGPVEYDHKPEECTAFAGLEVTPTVSNKSIISNGCTLDLSLVTDFSFVNGSGNEVFATIYAFRFFSSEFITLECKVRVCPSNETSCAIDCSKRRRRDEEGESTDKDEFDTVISQLRVLQPLKEEIIWQRSESASIESEMWWMIGVAIILKSM